MENPTPATQSPAPNPKSPIIMDSGVTKSCWQLRMVTERHELTSQQPPSASHSQFPTPPCRVDAVCAKITHPRPATQSPEPTAKSTIVMDSDVAKSCCQLRVVTKRHGLTSPQPPSASHVCAKITHPTQAAQSLAPVPKSSIVMNSSVAKSWCALPSEPLKRDEKSPQLAGKSRIVVASDKAKSCRTCTFIGQPCVSKQSRYGCDHCMKIGRRCVFSAQQRQMKSSPFKLCKSCEPCRNVHQACTFEKYAAKLLRTGATIITPGGGML